jgi:hypothetical protein
MQFELLKTFSREGPLTVVVDGDCMQGTISGGSRLRLESERKYWPGDVIAFKRNDGKIVCHRLLGYVPASNGWRVITRAENSVEVDKPVLLRNVLGKVTFVSDEPFHPELKTRARSVAQYFAAVIRWLAARLKNKLRRHDG